MPTHIFGRQPVLEALKASEPIEKILVLHGTAGNPIDRIGRLAKEQGIPVAQASRERFRELVGNQTTQGVIAILGSTRYVEIEEILNAARRKNEPAFVLVLDEIEDPHNLGALIRTAECAGVHGVIVPMHHSAPITETVTKASAGAVAHVPVARVTNIASALAELKKHGIWVIGSDANGDRVYDEVDYRGPVAIIVGNEGKGIRRLVKEKCDFLVRIPLHGKVESLNVSVAGGLMMFEVAKNRTAKPPGGS